MTKLLAMLLGCIIVDLPYDVLIKMGLGNVVSKQAGLLITCEPRDKDRLELGVYTAVNFCILVPDFESPDMTLISSEQSKRGGLAFETGDDANSPGYRYARGPPHELDLDSEQVNPQTGLVKRKASLNTKERLNVPTLNNMTVKRVNELGFLQHDISTGGITSTDIILNNMVGTMKDTPYKACAIELREKCRSAVAETQPAPSSGASFMTTSIPRKSATSRAVAGVAKAAITAVKGVIASRARSTIVTVAVLCGGLCTVGCTDIAIDLNMNVIHYCINDKTLCDFVSTQNPRAQMHTCDWGFLDGLRDGTIPCATHGTAPLLGIFELNSLSIRSSMSGPQSIYDYNVWHSNHQLLMLVLNASFFAPHCRISRDGATFYTHRERLLLCHRCP